MEYASYDSTEVEYVLTESKQTAKEKTVPLTFVCEFESSVSPTEFIDTVFNASDRYQSVGFEHKLKEDDEYYSISSVVTIGEGESEKLNCELCPNWMRVYISGDEEINPLVTFFELLSEEYPFRIKIADAYLR